MSARPNGLPRQTLDLVEGDRETVAGIGTELGDLTSGTVACFVREEPSGTDPLAGGNLPCVNPTDQGVVDVVFDALLALEVTADRWFTIEIEHLEGANRTTSPTDPADGITVRVRPERGDQ